MPYKFTITALSTVFNKCVSQQTAINVLIIAKTRFQKYCRSCPVLFFSFILNCFMYYLFLQGWTKEKVKIRLENSYLLSSIENNMFTVNSSMCDVVLVNGKYEGISQYSLPI